MFCTRGCTQQESLSLLTGRLVSLHSVPGMRQHLAELVLSEQLVRLQVLKGTGAADRDAHGGGADRVRGIDNDDPSWAPNIQYADASEGVRPVGERPLAQG